MRNPKFLLSILVFAVSLLLMLPEMIKGGNTIDIHDDAVASGGVENVEQMLLFTTGNLNIRTGPGTEHSIIMVIPKGETVEYISEEGEWINVKFKGYTGYSHRSYLTDEQIEDTTNSIIDDEAQEEMKFIKEILLVNRNYYLPESYSPGENPEARENLDLMLKAAKEEIKKDLVAFSGFRTYSYQKTVFDREVETSGLEYANKYVAKPGHSEHQTGLAFDIGGDSNLWADSGFDDTEEAKWLAENAHRFGFILRYPEGKENITGYNYESWHFRYVGKEHAKEIYDKGIALEEYLFDQ
ncbi:MAG: D-alanyl-D-alanine carboxypeptidase family protein [Gudongella sp.]|jgi:D-alanyl-D-alanine carboxypeptidase|nr:D-alanyl-D-alanine carboxypeptidase family protein [Gudongella sp.]